MTIIPPVAAVNVGASTGGGIIDSIKAAVGMGSPSPTQTPGQTSSGDGSVGLFDGVGKKALIGGAAGAVLGFLPFIPGGPILGGIVGALGGAAMGVFGNWRKMQAIKAENQATLAAMGVQTNDPNVQQMLQAGKVDQLAAYAQSQQAAGATQTGATQAGATQAAPAATATTAATAAPAQTASRPVQNIQQVTDPTTGSTQLVDITTGQVVNSTAPTTTQVGSAAIDPSVGADPGAVPTAGGGSTLADTKALI
ncbi:MAG: hypothetical protein JWN41_195, partial [Thermoleophilia bacterium]|nr:hypothetical protein [Thermoleophilia bacterium]